jgi:DNA invertase Pin-like site-specific DNA recombinase
MQEIKYKAIIYIRLSVADDKQGESDSVANQRKLIDEWLKSRPEIETVGEKVDDGWSGLIFDRPAFREMMDEMAAGNANCCITKDLSRLSREHVDTLSYLRRIFPQLGVRFIAINDNIDTLTDSGYDLAVSLKSIINDAYCRDISVKTRSALNVKRSNGDYVGACPVYGYRKSDDNNNLLIPDEYPASIVREIFRMKLDGLSAARIADSLNGLGVLSPYMYKKERGLPHPKKGYADVDGAKWSPQTVIRILGDETYAGTLIQGKQSTPNYKLKERVDRPVSEWKRRENAHEAIIGKQDFDLVRRLMRLDTRTAPDGDSVYPFSGLLICGSCGNRMTRATRRRGKNVYHYYYCPTTKKRGCDSEGMLSEKDLINVVLNSIKGKIATVISLDDILKSIDAERAGRRIADRLRVQHNENGRRLEQIRKFKAGLYENMVGGLISKDDYTALKAKYAYDADALEAANAKLEQEIEDALACKTERLLWLEHFRQFENLDAINRKVVSILIKSIRVIGKREITIDYNYQDEYEAAAQMSGIGVPANASVRGERTSDEAGELSRLRGSEHSAVREDEEGRET